MKNYNREILDLNIKALKGASKDKRSIFYPWVIDLAMQFSTAHSRIGVSDRNDVMQECLLAFEEAWQRIDWDEIDSKSEEEQGAIIWGFLKKSIQSKVLNRLAYVSNAIRVVRQNGMLMAGVKNVDEFIMIIYPRFFDIGKNNRTIWEEETPELWDIERLAYALDVAMRTLLSNIDRNILEYSFGIGYDKRYSSTEIGKIVGLSANSVLKRRKRALNAMNCPECKDIIRNNF